MNPHYFLKTVFFSSVVLGSAFVYAEQNQNSNSTSYENTATRKIASYSLPASLATNDNVILKPMGLPRGQGEQMLDELTSNEAPYLKRKAPRIFVAGVCRTSNAAYYQTGQKGYADCLENNGFPNSNSASSLSAGQQRAGAALLIPVPR